MTWRQGFLLSQFWRGIHPSPVQGAREEKTDLSLWAGGGDGTPRKNFLQPPEVRGAVRRGWSLGRLRGWDVTLQQALVKSRKVVLAAEGEAAPKPEGLRSQWG